MSEISGNVTKNYKITELRGNSKKESPKSNLKIKSSYKENG